MPSTPSLQIETDRAVILAGDWHGNHIEAHRVVKHAVEHNVGIILHLGDFGIHKNDKPYLEKLQKDLHDANIHLFFIDGNHEDFPRLYDKKKLPDGTRFVRNNISYLPRGYRFSINGVTFLAMGGAASVSRRFLRQGMSWWPEELITDEDVERGSAGGYADVMLCHDSPYSAPNLIVDDVMNSIKAEKRFHREHMLVCLEHRKQLDRVVQAVRPKWLFHGHYHKYMRGVFGYAGSDQKTTVIGLDQGKASLPIHTMLLTSDLKEDLELDSIQGLSV